MTFVPRDNSAPSREPASKPRLAKTAPALPSQPWDVIVSSLLNEMDQRLGAMRSSWLAAETQRLRTLLVESRARDAGDRGMPDRLQMLRSLADMEPSLLEGEAEAAALIEKCEAIINRCAKAMRSDSTTVHSQRRSSAA